jgi:single-strand DNA-binding protein
MPKSINKITIAGHIGGIDNHYSSSGTHICNLSIAETYSIRGEKKTQWHKCTAFGNVADTISENYEKGDWICLEGQIREEQWTDKSGMERRVWKVIAWKVATMLEVLGEEEARKYEAMKESKKKGEKEPAYDDEDIPF